MWISMLWLAIYVWSVSVLAQGTWTSENQTAPSDIQTTNSHNGLSVYYMKELKYINMRFCNKPWEDSVHDDALVIDPTKDNSIRVCVNNVGDKEYEVIYWWTIWYYTAEWTRVCDTNIWSNEFNVMIPNQTPERIFRIKPWDDQIIEEKIVIPPGMSGLQMWCLIYKLSNYVSEWQAWMLNVVIQKYWYLDIMVWWFTSVKKDIAVLESTWWVTSTNKQIKAVIDNENNLWLSISVENKGNISQNITVTGKIYNILGFQKEFSAPMKLVGPAQKSEFMLNGGILPAYKWLYSVKLNVTNVPVYMFTVNDEKAKEGGYTIIKGNIFIFSWVLVVVAIFIILILIKLISPRRNKQPQIAN